VHLRVPIVCNPDILHLWLLWYSASYFLICYVVGTSLRSFCLAYFVARKGEKKIYACVFCIYFADLSVMPVCMYSAIILQLFQVCVDVVLDVTTS